jgi:flagellar motor switch protein FliN
MANELETPVATDDWSAAMAEQGGSVAPTQLSDTATTARAAIFQRLTGDGGEVHNDIDLILDIPVQLTVELGRTRIPIKHILQLAQGSVIELDALAGEPMDVLVNGCLIAQGEVVVVNDKFGVRLTDVTTQSERIRRLKR